MSADDAEAKIAELRSLLAMANEDIYRREASHGGLLARFYAAEAEIEDLRASITRANSLLDAGISKARQDVNEFCRYVMQDQPILPTLYSKAMLDLAKSAADEVQYVTARPAPVSVWNTMKSGEVTGFSIGGYAPRTKPSIPYNFVAQRYAISYADIILSQLDCRPPVRTRTGAWRVGRRRFRTKYLAACYLARNSARRGCATYCDPPYSTTTGYQRAAREAHEALWRPRTIRVTCKKPDPNWWRNQPLSNTTPGIFYPWQPEIRRRVYLPPGPFADSVRETAQSSGVDFVFTDA